MVLPIFVFNLVNIASELYQIVPPYCGADRRAVPQAHQSRDNDVAWRSGWSRAWRL